MAAIVIFWGCLTAQQRQSNGQFAAVAAGSWVVAGLVSCVIGLCQYYGLADSFSPWMNSNSIGKAFANLRQPNQFATLTNIALAAVIWLAVRPSIGLVSDNYFSRYKYLWVLCACLLAIGNAASASRTGLVQLLALCAVSFYWQGRHHTLVKRVLLAALMSYGMAVWLLPTLAGLDLSVYGTMARIQQGDRLCASRITLWSNVLHLIAQKPWLGWGWGELDYAHFITLYNEPRFCDILDNAHSLPLQLAVELGVPFALLVCGGFTWWALRQKPWAERDVTRQMAWAVMAVILLHSMLEYPLWYGPFQMTFGICVLLLWRQKQPLEAENASKKVSNQPPAQISRAQAAIISVASMLLLFTVYATWDYRRISQIYLEPESRSAAYRTDTLSKIRSSWLFADQVQFAELLITPITPANAAWTFDTARQLLHYSPEPRVIEKLIESAVMLGKDEDALAYLARYRAAFPKEHALWAKSNAMPNAKAN